MKREEEAQCRVYGVQGNLLWLITTIHCLQKGRLRSDSQSVS